MFKFVYLIDFLSYVFHSGIYGIKFETKEDKIKPTTKLKSSINSTVISGTTNNKVAPIQLEFRRHQMYTFTLL